MFKEVSDMWRRIDCPVAHRHHGQKKCLNLFLRQEKVIKRFKQGITRSVLHLKYITDLCYREFANRKTSLKILSPPLRRPRVIGSRSVHGCVVLDVQALNLPVGIRHERRLR